jgi:hypothetical protein
MIEFHLKALVQRVEVPDRTSIEIQVPEPRAQGRDEFRQPALSAGIVRYGHFNMQARCWEAAVE